MTDPRAYLAEVQQRAEAAAPGPWVPHDLSDAVFNSENSNGWWWVWQQSKLPYYGGVLKIDDHGEPKGSIGEACITDQVDGDAEHRDAEFIAHAREDVPRLAAALIAVLEMHRPVDVSTGVGMTQEYDGTWSRVTLSTKQQCERCHGRISNDSGAYPCDHVRVITAAFGGDLR